MYDEESDGGPKGTFEIYKAEADTLFKQGEYRKAIHSYTTALDLQPGDQNCMVSRSKCYLKLGDTAKSLADAEASLAEDKTYHKGLFQKAEALYYKGDFEMALVFYHRGHKLRPELQEFRLGIQKAQEAIDNSVGSSDTVKLTTKGDLSFFQKQDEKKTKKKTYGSYNKQQQKQVKPKREIITNPALEKTVKQLLGELYGDKIYLEKLLKEIDPKSDTGKTIYDLVEEGLSYLDTRTEFWMQQKPMYARQHEKVMQSKAQKTGGQESPNDYIIKELEKIDQAQAEGRFEDSLKRAERCMATVNNYPDSILTNKLSVVANLHSCLGNAFLELKKYAKAEDHHTMDLNIGQKHGIEEAESRGLDNLGRVYARTGKFDKAIQVWEKKIPMSKSDLESTWLYHEVGRCHLELGHLDKAREYGEKSYEAAEKADDDQWQLQATVLIAQAQVKLGEFEPALESFEKALDISKVIGDERAEVAIKKAMDEVNAKIVQYMKDNKTNGGAEKAENVAEEGDTGEAEEPKADNSNTENTLGEAET